MAIWPPSAAAEERTAARRASRRVFMPALAPGSAPRITGWRAGGHGGVRLRDTRGMVSGV
jgi:hypothetical protein